jgi:hypothetical protein
VLTITIHRFNEGEISTLIKERYIYLLAIEFVDIFVPRYKLHKFSYRAGTLIKHRLMYFFGLCILRKLLTIKPVVGAGLGIILIL